MILILFIILSIHFVLFYIFNFQISLINMSYFHNQEKRSYSQSSSLSLWGHSQASLPFQKTVWKCVLRNLKPYPATGLVQFWVSILRKTLNTEKALYTKVFITALFRRANRSTWMSNDRGRAKWTMVHSFAGSLYPQFKNVYNEQPGETYKITTKTSQSEHIRMPMQRKKH